MPRHDLIIFDFDGVVADSELLANEVLAEMVSALGRPTSLEDSLDRYQGRRTAELMAAISEDLGRPVPVDLPDLLLERTLERFRLDLRPVAGVVAFLDRHAVCSRCIASSSAPERLALSLDSLGLADRFTGRVFSADSVPRGKPFPDIFLHAARSMGADPAATLVIEDSPAGIRAAVAAGMTAVGLLAAGHIRPGHAARLWDAGAHHVVESFDAISRLLETAPARPA